ncbi:MAG: DPP IV N-terminal domain-containing protein, partial [Acidobacteriota bacterium]
MKLTRLLLQLVVVLYVVAPVGKAQGTIADYERAISLREEYTSRAVNISDRANWIGQSNHFWYRKTVSGGSAFVWVDAETAAKRPAFDHGRLSASLSAAANAKYTALNLPFTTISLVDGEKAVEFNVDENRWRCDLTDYTCKQVPAAAGGFGLRRGGGTQNGIPGPRYNFPGAEARLSPDGKSEAWINNFNVYVRPKGKKEGVALSFDGSEGNYYALASIAWSPDSTKLAAYRVRAGYERKIQYVQSSPDEQLQPKYVTLDYAKPGDALNAPQPVLFHVASRKAFVIDDTLFPNPYQLSRIEWRKDGSRFTFEYNQRGHEVFRVIEVDAASAKPRAVISEEPKTFFCYSGKKFRADINDGKEIIWMSERDGWNHLYLFDGVTGALRNQITKGSWVVREVTKVDEEKRQIWFQASGMYPGKDPYFVHYYRINFDGTGLTALTEADATH